MSFQGKYEALSALNDGETQSFRAREVSSGRSVLIHRLAAGRTPAGQPDLAFLIFQFLRSASAEEARYLLDMGEDDGRVFVVTIDAAGCLDLRRWLQSAIEAQASKSKSAPAVGEEGLLEPGNFDFTRTFTSQALRQLTRLQTKPSSPPSASPVAPPPEPALQPPLAEQALPPEQAPEPPSKGTDSGSHDFTMFWEKYYPDGGERRPSSESAPGAPQSKRGSDSIVPGPPAIAASSSPASIDEVDISAPESPSPVKAAVSVTSTPKGLGEPAKENSKATPQPIAPSAPDNQAAGAEQAPRRPVPSGFEVVFQSNKPRSRPTLSGVFDRSGNPISPGALRSPVGDRRLAPGERLPDIAKPIEPRPVGGAGSSSATSFFKASAEAKQAPAVGEDSPLPTSPQPEPPGVDESEKPTRQVMAPTVPEPAPAPVPGVPSAAVGATPVPVSPLQPVVTRPGGSTHGFSASRVLPVSREPQATSVAAATPLPSLRSPQGEYTRMVENLGSSAGPLPALNAQETATSRVGRETVPARPTPLSARASWSSPPVAQTPISPGGPSRFQPSVYLADDTLPHARGGKRKVWVPILIFSSLFMMTLGLLLFFAFKH